jgi:hypothetical protein
LRRPNGLRKLLFFLRIHYESKANKGELLSTIKFLSWQDGGVVMQKGKLPLERLMPFSAKTVLIEEASFASLLMCRYPM